MLHNTNHVWYPAGSRKYDHKGFDMQDTIRREVSIKASKEKIYDAIANPEKVVLWFPDSV